MRRDQKMREGRRLADAEALPEESPTELGYAPGLAITWPGAIRDSESDWRRASAQCCRHEN